jgi:hypothetical protein
MKLLKVSEGFGTRLGLDWSYSELGKGKQSWLWIRTKRISSRNGHW